MDECIQAFSAFSDALQKALVESDPNDHNIGWLKEQLASVSDRMGNITDSLSIPVADHEVLSNSYHSSSVDVLTPGHKGSEYTRDSMGATGVHRRQICRLSSTSAVKNPHMAERFVTELSYRTNHSAIVTVAPPKENNSQWKSSSRRNTFLRGNQPPLPPPYNKLPVKDFKIKITKVSAIAYPLPVGPPLPFQLLTKENNSDTSGFEDGPGQLNCPLNSGVDFPSQLPANDNDTVESDLECLSPSLLANEKPWNENESQTNVQYEDDGCSSLGDQSDSDSSNHHGNQSQLRSLKSNIMKKRIRFTSDSSMDVELHVPRNESTQENENQPIQENENQPIQENENQPIQENENQPLQENENQPIQENENQSIQENENQSEQDNDLVKQNENRSDKSGNESDNEHEFWSVVKEDINQKPNKSRKIPKPSPTKPKDDLPLMYSCCGCGKTIYRSVDLICFNHRLNVIICESCFKSLTKGQFIIDEGHEIFCTMCGDGGCLVLCDFCEKSVCRDCVERFIGLDGLAEILEDSDTKWSCFTCDPQPIHKHQIYCKLYKETKEMDEIIGRKRRTAVNMAEPPLMFESVAKKKKRSGKDHGTSMKHIKREIGSPWSSKGRDKTTNAVPDTDSDTDDESVGSGRRRGLKGGASVLEGIHLLRKYPKGGTSRNVCCRHGPEVFIDSDNASTSSEDNHGCGQTTVAMDNDDKEYNNETGVVDNEVEIDNNDLHDSILGDEVGVVNDEVGEDVASDNEESVDKKEGMSNDEVGVSSDNEMGVSDNEVGVVNDEVGEGVASDNEVSVNKEEGMLNDEVGVSSDNEMGVSDNEVGVVNKEGTSDDEVGVTGELNDDVSDNGRESISISDNEVGVVNKDVDLDSEDNDHESSDDKKGEVGVANKTPTESTSDDMEPMILERPTRSTIQRDSSPLSLLDGLLSSSDISSNDVSLSDSDFLNELQRDRSKGNKTVAVVNSDSNSNSSNKIEGSNSSGDHDQKKKKRLSLKTKKSWLLNRSEYGAEKEFEKEEAKKKEEMVDTSSSDDQGQEDDGVKKGKRNKKKKIKSSFYCISDEDDCVSPKEKSRHNNENKLDSSSKADSKSVISKKKKKDFFSSDEEESNVFTTLLSSSSDDEAFKPLTTSTANKPSETTFHLAAISSDDDSDEFKKSPPPKKRRAVLLSTGSSSTATLNDNGDSSDDFESNQRHRPCNIVKASIKKQKKRMNRSWFDSDNENDSSDSNESKASSKKQEQLSTPLKKEGSSGSSDVEIISTPVKRKNIRKLMSNNKLTSITREAQKAEKERRERLRKRTKSANDEGDDTGAANVPIVLESNEETTLEVRKELVPKILPHQIKGIKFLYDSCCEDLRRLNNEPGSGAILAHCMGLGKTLQIIAFIDTLLLHRSATGIKKVMVLSPVNTLLNWLDEWNKWVPIGLRKYRVTALNEKSNNTRINVLERWHRMGGVIIIGYTMFRTLTSAKSLKRKSDQISAKKCLCDPGADIVVCDEGHVLKQEKSCLSVAVNKVKTKRRIVLTGTPLQNNLMEYYTMCSFVKPDLLGTVKEFRNQFENPIRNGQHSDSRPMDVRRMKQRAHILHQLLKGCIDRRDYRILAEALPPKNEYVVGIRMTPVQDQLIMRYLDKNSGDHTSSDLFSTFANLLKVWNHPRVLELDQDRKDEREERKMLDNFIDDGEDEDMDGFIVYNSDSDVELVEPKDENKDKKMATLSGDNKSDSRSASPSWYQDVLPDNCGTMLELSGKVQFLLELLKEVEKVDEKILVFSQSLLVLDMIEEMLQLPECGAMLEGVHYFRLDGSTKVDDRRQLMKRFNRKSVSNQLRLFLISTKAGSLGINLIGANRVVIFDACWNPTHDLQSIFRTYRFGQTKPVFVYRLLAKGTMEEKIYDRQVTKQSLSMRVIDEKQIGRHFSFSQLQELFVYTPPPPPPDTPPTEPYSSPESDIIFCNILDKLRPQCIVGYHTHDSLLEHIYDEELSAEEQKLAWENYNMQKEMDSREYNMSLQLQQNRAALQSLGGAINSSVGPGMGVAGASSGIGTGLQHPTGLPVAIPNSTSIITYSNSVLETAKQVRGLLMLRNQLKATVLDPNNGSVRQRYITTCQTLDNKVAVLNKGITPALNLLQNPQIRATLNVPSLREFDSLKAQLIDFTNTITLLSQMPAPDHRQLAPPPTSGDQFISSLLNTVIMKQN